MSDLSKLRGKLSVIRRLIEGNEPIFSSSAGRQDTGQETLQLDTAKLNDGIQRWSEQISTVIDEMTRGLRRASHVGDSGGYGEARRELLQLSAQLADFDKQLAELEQRAAGMVKR